MNLNPFKKFKSADPRKDKYVKQLRELSLDMSKKLVTGRLTEKEVTKYDEVCKAYYKEFPSLEEEIQTNKRIIKLRKVISLL